MQRFGTWAALAVVAAGCGENDVILAAQIELTFGLEPDVWSDAPAPDEVVVSRVGSDGSRSEHERLEPPVHRFSMGDGGATAFEVEVVDEAGSTVARARSLVVRPRDLVGASMPLFISRTEQFSRPARLGRSHGDDPPAVVIAGRYLLVAGAIEGRQVASDIFDLATWAPVESPPRFRCPAEPCRFSSLAAVGEDENLVLAIGDDWAIWLDLGTFASGPAELPAGLTSFSEVAAGRTVPAPSGDAYVVGASRGDAPTDAVLRVSAGGDLETIRLTTRRAGAAVAWADGRGLVVAAGSSAGAGIEVLEPGGRFVELPYPPDGTSEAALVPLDVGTFLRVGGEDGTGEPAETVEIDLDCSESCAPSRRDVAIDLREAVAFTTSLGPPLLVGRGTNGDTTAVFLDGTRVPLKEPRSRATALRLPTGHVALVGGIAPGGAGATALELYPQ